MRKLASFWCFAVLLTVAQTKIAGKQSSSTRPPCGRRVIAYYTATSTVPLRPWQARLLTHINYSFLFLLPNGTLSIDQPLSGSSSAAEQLSRADDGRKARETIQHLRTIRQKLADDEGQQLKLFFSIGGWDVNSRLFSRVANNRTLTGNFISSALKLVQEFDFDGIDLDWEFPVLGGDAGGGEEYALPEDAQNQVKFVSALRSALINANTPISSKQYLLTMAIPGAMCNLVTGYDLPGLLPHLDWFNVMTYDYFTTWNMPKGALTGPSAPLYAGGPNSIAEDKMNYSEKNVDFTIKYLTCQLEAIIRNSNWTIDRMLNKLVLGLPFYGRYWNNVDVTQQLIKGNDLWRVALQDKYGNITGGLISYSEVRAKWLQKDGSVLGFDEQTRSPFVWNAKEKVLLSYQNERSIRERTEYAIEYGLGGVMFWAMDLDDESLHAKENNGSLLEAVANTGVCGQAEKANKTLKTKKFNCEGTQLTKLMTKAESERIYGRCQN